MRVAIFYARRRNWPKMGWVAQAFRRLGHDVVCSDDQDMLPEFDASNDLVLLPQRGGCMCHNLAAKFAPDRKAIWATWIFDLVVTEPGKPIVEQEIMAEQWLRLLRLLDLVFVKERGLLGEYREAGVNAIWLDQGCPSDMKACEHVDSPQYDVLVIGSSKSYWRQRRQDAAALAAEGFVVGWAGHAAGAGVPSGVLPLPFCRPEDLPELVSQAALCLDVDARTDLDGYRSDRMWLLAGMGACSLRRWSPGLPDRYPILTYRTEAELLEWAGQLRTDTVRRRALGEANRSWTMGAHTYQDRCREIIVEVERCKSQDAACAESAGAAR